MDVLDIVRRDPDGRIQYHFVVVDYLCRSATQALRCGSDADEARWVEVDGLDAYQLTEKAASVIHAAIALARERSEDAERGRRAGSNPFHWTRMNDPNWSIAHVPLLQHPVEEETAFTPDALIEAVRRARRLPDTAVPAVCVLEFDGDLTDWLVTTHVARPWPTWACFHTPMFAIDVDGHTCGIVPRTIGGPYAVLVAEQLAASGARVIVGLTSAGRVRPDLPIPSLVVATSAVRDEGTSYHYLPPQQTIEAPGAVVPFLFEELSQLGVPVTRGSVWTTDAPYRETRRQLKQHADERRARRRNAGRLALRVLGRARHAGGGCGPREQRHRPHG